MTTLFLTLRSKRDATLATVGEPTARCSHREQTISSPLTGCGALPAAIASAVRDESLVVEPARQIVGIGCRLPSSQDGGVSLQFTPFFLCPLLDRGPQFSANGTGEDWVAGDLPALDPLCSANIASVRPRAWWHAAVGRPTVQTISSDSEFSVCCPSRASTAVGLRCTSARSSR